MTNLMNNPYDLEERLIDFAVDVINIVEVLPNSKAGSHIANQLVRSGFRPSTLTFIDSKQPRGVPHLAPDAQVPEEA
jgi:hypothetical protein